MTFRNPCKSHVQYRTAAIRVFFCLVFFERISGSVRTIEGSPQTLELWGGVLRHATLHVPGSGEAGQGCFGLTGSSFESIREQDPRCNGRVGIPLGGLVTDTCGGEDIISPGSHPGEERGINTRALGCSLLVSDLSHGWIAALEDY